jgi:hypothetical protein
MGKKSLEVQKKRVQEESTQIVATTNKLIYKGNLTYGICDNEKNQQEGKPIKGTRNNYSVGGEACKHWRINKTFQH